MQILVRHIFILLITLTGLSSTSQAQTPPSCISLEKGKCDLPRIRSERIWFANGDTEILPQSKECLQHLSQYLSEQKGKEWEIRVYFLPINKKNIRLSEQRAEEIAQHLAGQGLPRECLHPQPMGKQKDLQTELHYRDSPETFYRIELQERKNGCD